MSEVKSGFRRLLELTDKSAREELNSYYIISESRMDNYLNCLENGAKQIADLRAQLAEAQKEAYPAYKREKALRCKAENELAEARKEIERMKNKEHVLFDIHDSLGIKWGDNPYKVIDDLKKAEAENAELRARLKGVEKFPEGLKWINSQHLCPYFRKPGKDLHNGIWQEY